MRLLTFNLWHGLSPGNSLIFESLEPTARRALREKMQLKLIEGLDPDICFFQEVNPASVRIKDFKYKLGLQSVYQPDLVGTKLFGVGFPLNLNSALVTSVSQKWRQKWVDGVSLSRPGLSRVRSWASWQLSEERFALFSETVLPKWGKILLVNTHLHHGLESTVEFRAQLEQLTDELELPASMVTELKDRIARANERRKHEVSVLLQAMEKRQKKYAMVIMAGDFNASPENELNHILREMGFSDVWTEVHGQEPGFTFDKDKNKANHLLQGQFPLSLVLEDLSFSVKVKEALMGLARRQEERPRRIDYLWIRSQRKINFKAATLVGMPDADGLAPSDHFGVMADIEAIEE